MLAAAQHCSCFIIRIKLQLRCVLKFEENLQCNTQQLQRNRYNDLIRPQGLLRIFIWWQIGDEGVGFERGGTGNVEFWGVAHKGLHLVQNYNLHCRNCNLNPKFHLKRFQQKFHLNRFQTNPISIHHNIY